MKVELLYVRDCPNHPLTLEAVRDVLRENGLPLDITEIEISSSAQAMTLLFPGSQINSFIINHLNNLEFQNEIAGVI